MEPLLADKKNGHLEKLRGWNGKIGARMHSWSQKNLDITEYQISDKIYPLYEGFSASKIP